MENKCRGGYYPPAMKKRILSLVVVLTLLIGCVPIIAGAEILDSGTCGVNVTWTLYDNGTLTISGTGDMYYYGVNNSPFSIHKTRIKSVIIEDGITNISSNAFYLCELTSITIPNSVKGIANSAFHSCEKLTSITIPDNDIYISADAFSNTAYYNDNSNWEDGVLYIGNHLIKAKSNEIAAKYQVRDGTKTIAEWAFDDCSNLTGITIPDSVTSIGIATFSLCDNLTNITIPDSVTSIGNGAFSQTAYYNDSNNWENGVLYIGNHLIKAKNSEINTNYQIKDGTKLIADRAFDECSNLTGITIPDSVTCINQNAFTNCSSLTNVTIPDNITSISEGAFAYCNSLKSVTIPNSVTCIGMDAFFKCSNLTDITIPDSVTCIEQNAFNKCSSLKSVTIPNSVTCISGFVFNNCSSLANITIPDSVTDITASAFSNTAYYEDSNNWENGVLYIGNHLIKAKSDDIATNYQIKDGTRTIARSAFKDCSNLTDIAIPDSITSISAAAFGNCSSLKSVTIPDSVTDISFNAFIGCNSLKDVYYGGSEQDRARISISIINNATLTNATWHYTGSSSATPTPTATPIPTSSPIPTPTLIPIIPVTTAEITRTDTDADTSYSFEVNAAQKPADCFVYTAIYDETHTLIALSCVPLETVSTTTVSVEKMENAKTAKVFIWAKTFQAIVEQAKEFSLT